MGGEHCVELGGEEADVVDSDLAASLQRNQEENERVGLLSVGA